ncbi:drug resistance transporter, EmrB/QacA subfamily [Amycolatopsis sacchari]|uniref:Drug resistance transporter, EmrB/QacA subfamily n=1 Tax=Amycolatopsis sacchari TaxID=115433 RepID=A0A1I3YRN6_9PSEU|nr:drug resistance transporter, EmrB/QacA subfamily [Amycolatopsis sacchari]
MGTRGAGNSFSLSEWTGIAAVTLLCAIGFMDMIDAVIVNVAMPAIQHRFGLPQQSLQWVVSGYLLTYGGGMLLGGRAADLVGRRPVLVVGVTVFAAASLIGGLAPTPGVLIGARVVQGAGAAAMMPAALSLVMTSFGTDRVRAVGIWSGTLGLATTAGVLLGGVLTEVFGWRSVLLINPIVCVVILAGVFRLLPDDRRRATWRTVDVAGAVSSTGGLGLLIWAVVEAPHAGWGALSTVVRLAGAAVLLVVFVWNERRCERRGGKPLVPLSIVRVRGLVAANATQAVAIGGLYGMFFFVTLYMQNVLGYSALQTGLAYLPATSGVVLGAGVATKFLIPWAGTLPVIVGGLVVAAGGVWWLSLLPVHGSYPSDILPGLLGFSLGLGLVFVAVMNAATAEVTPERSGLASALVQISTQVGGAIGIAVLIAFAAAHTTGLLAAGVPVSGALTGGFRLALRVSSIAVLVAAVLGLRTVNTRDTTSGMMGG